MANEIILLSRSDIETLMPFGDYVEAVANAFRLQAEGQATTPAPLHIPAEGGGFHVKSASLPLGRRYVAIKTNANFPQNRRLRDLPTIQGAILLFDAEDGRPLAFLDSIEITIKRTGAATAVAARYLARPDSRTATICGCGEQGRIQLAALRHVLDIRRVFAWDREAAAAAGFADAMSKRHGIDVEAPASLRAATLESDVIVACTPSRQPYLGPGDVRAGTFIAAVGADNPDKSEVHPDLMARATVVTDILAQCATMGDLHHAIAAGRMTLEAVHAELGDLVAGRRVGRSRADEITIFDSSGTGIQDVAAAARAFELAHERGVGTRFRLG
ncbi:MAG TPA: ornithine cyclodeaminase family protein [Xanthobacteraceae bacterium]|nr:ornithine cyclodeaminase family protein [Xanthobacteraceae bacterium]